LTRERLGYVSVYGRRPMGRVAAGIVVATCVMLASCAADGDANPGLQATLQRSTLFETQRALLLEVRPDGDHDLEVGAIQLSSPLFETVPPEPRDALVRASDRAVAMPLPFGAARCDGAADGPAQLITDVDGEEVRVALDESPPGVLVALHAAECAAAAVLADVELRLGARWELTAPRTVEGDLEVVQRRPGVTAAVEDLAGNVIFSVSTDDGPGPWLEVSDDHPSAGGVVVVYAARCDPHALIEYKRTFTLSAWVRVGGDEPVRVDVEAEGDAHRVLEELLAACLE
jgi:hypothetical protein